MSPTLVSLSLRYEDHRLYILDQRNLPHREDWVAVENPDHMVALIQGLAVRGAPLIGVSAALALAQFAMEKPRKLEQLQKVILQLREARPTAVNLMWAMDRMSREVPGGEAEQVERVAERIFLEDVAMCEVLASHGEKIVPERAGILTLCNTGGLATAGVGTAFGVMQKAHEAKKAIHVYACETRPLLQGGRLTAWELAKAGIPHTLLCDSMAAVLMRMGKVQLCIVGADRIAANGDFANKIGSYALAVLAKHHGIPFYVAAPLSTVDLTCESGAQIPIEERPGEEVRGFRSAAGAVEWAPHGVPVFNPSFDVVPGNLVSGIVLNTGVFSVTEFQNQKGN